MKKIGHRGYPAGAPANTMASFAAALRLDCNWVECDCRLSRDGVVVLSHDETVTDLDGTVHSVAYSDAAVLAALNLGAGEGVPTLDSLIEWAAGRCGVMADFKSDGIAPGVVRALRRLPMGSSVVPGAGTSARTELRSLWREVPLSTTLDAHVGDVLNVLQSVDTPTVTPNRALVDEQFMDCCRRLRLEVLVWTVDGVDEMRRLATLGVDGIISNRADLLAELGDSG